MPETHAPTPRDVLRLPDFRLLLGARLADSLSGQALNVAVGYQLYALTHDPLSLGALGLAEAIPALSLQLFGGHAADRFDRRRILVATRCIGILCALALAVVAALRPNLWAIYAVVFVQGLTRGFAGPAMAALDAQLVPRPLQARAAPFSSTVWQGGGIAGAALGGGALATVGAAGTFTLAAVLVCLSLIAIARIAPHPIPPPPPDEETIWQSLAAGVRFVFKNQYLVAPMALDLFAVLFGGVIALLPVFARDILHVGTFEFGLLNAAPGAGALLVMAAMTQRPLPRRAGGLLFGSIAAFGVCILVFALSKALWLSLLALFLTGVFDGISMVIRSTVLRLMSPEGMRGRIAAVSGIFIGASNELGAFESGVAARLLGTVTSVVFGGTLTLLTVAVTAALAPKLRRLDLSEHDVA
jgi:MFS family permease